MAHIFTVLVLILHSAGSLIDSRRNETLKKVADEERKWIKISVRY